MRQDIAGTTFSATAMPPWTRSNANGRYCDLILDMHQDERTHSKPESIRCLFYFGGPLCRLWMFWVKSCSQKIWPHPAEGAQIGVWNSPFISVILITQERRNPDTAVSPRQNAQKRCHPVSACPWWWYNIVKLLWFCTHNGVITVSAWAFSLGGDANSVFLLNCDFERNPRSLFMVFFIHVICNRLAFRWEGKSITYKMNERYHEKRSWISLKIAVQQKDWICITS